MLYYQNFQYYPKVIKFETITLTFEYAIFHLRRIMLKYILTLVFLLNTIGVVKVRFFIYFNLILSYLYSFSYYNMIFKSDISNHLSI